MFDLPERFLFNGKAEINMVATHIHSIQIIFPININLLNEKILLLYQYS